MKKTIILSLILMIFVGFSMPKIKTKAENKYYAKIQSSKVYFYNQPQEKEDFILFKIPCSYFVLLTQNAGEDFYLANYKNITGYVKKNDVTVMSGQPLTPYPNCTFRVFDMEGQGLYSNPSYGSDKLLTIPYLSQNINFYGYKLGQEGIPEKSNKWIYCSFSTDKENYGYVYSVFCDKLEIKENNESFDVVTNPIFTPLEEVQPMSPTSMGLIIAGVSIPCIAVLILLIRPTLLKDKTIHSRPKSRKRKGDYFEFDDGELN